MGPVRGLRKRKKVEKKHDENGSASASEFSKRINGRFLLTSNSFTALSFIFALLFIFDIVFNR